MQRVLLFLVLAAACGRSPDDSPTSPGATAAVRFMNVATGTAAVDFLVGNQVVAGGVAFAHLSPEVALPSGERTIAVRRSGDGIPLTSSRVSLQAGARYALMIGSNGDTITLTPRVLADTGAADPARANIRIINLPGVIDSSQAAAPLPLEVHITAPGTPLGAGTRAFTLNAAQSSYSSLLPFTPGLLAVRFAVPGTLQVVAEAPGMTVGAGEIRAVTLQRQAGGAWQVTVVSER